MKYNDKINYLLKYGFTVKEIGKHLHVNTATVYNWKHAWAEPNKENTRLLNEFFDNKINKKIRSLCILEESNND